VVRTFQDQFKYTLMWLTHYDAELVGSNSPIVIDEAELERRIARPPIAADLQRVLMGSAADFLSYYVMGTDGMTRFGRGGALNTDDNLYLEFSAPFSIATRSVMEANVNALSAQRESILPYLTAPTDPKARQEQRGRWESLQQAGKAADPALALFLGGKAGSLEFRRLLGELEARYPWYAPGRFLKMEYDSVLAMEPRPVSALALTLLNESGQRVIVELSAVLVPVSKSRASVMFVDNRAKVVYGQQYVNDYAQGDVVQRLVDDVMATVRGAYQQEAEHSARQRQAFPAAESALRQIRDAIGGKLRALSTNS
jgi:spermidine synthase